MDPEKKVWTLFSLLNMESPKVQNVSHWLSKILKKTIYVYTYTLYGYDIQYVYYLLASCWEIKQKHTSS